MESVRFVTFHAVRVSEFLQIVQVVDKIWYLMVKIQNAHVILDCILIILQEPVKIAIHQLVPYVLAQADNLAKVVLIFQI